MAKLSKVLAFLCAVVVVPPDNLLGKHPTGLLGSVLCAVGFIPCAVFFCGYFQVLHMADKFMLVNFSECIAATTR